MKIGIMADSHDNIVDIKKALEVFEKEKVDLILHAGDFVAPFALIPISSVNCKFVAVFGNNDGEKEGLTRAIKGFWGEVSEPPYVFELERKRFMLTHEAPENILAKAVSENLDYLIYGHTHESLIEQGRECIVINPGECGGWLYGVSTVAILDTETDECRIIEFARKEGLKSKG